ncbi:MAG TPA: M43 family zinc metalloprotease [Cyclobacteriaceae bacterium]|nr:M43 family zinc metalloprotease [Cyclobacteriaceae bacterium]
MKRIIVKRQQLLLCFFMLLGLSATYAQAPTIKNCATMEQDSLNRIKYPQMQSVLDYEDAIRLKINEIEARRKSGRTQAVVLTIPIIVHVVHTGEPVGTGLNLSRAQVQAQIDVLNEDFRRKTDTPGFNSSPVGADIEIEFCLSPVDEAGTLLTEPGIHRVRGNNTVWTRDQIEGSLKPQTIWNPNLFYNVWTLKFGGVDANLLGYAQFPDQSGLSGLNPVGGPASTDGVVIQYSSFGSVDKGTFPVMQAPYNHGRTLSHETGHWLGLRHIWGDGACANDFVDDTPTQHAENRGCPTTKTSCDGVSLEMPQNYMDYSDDACMNIFTTGQKSRIRAVMELSPRRKVLTQANLCANVVEGPPVANFTTDKQSVLRGGEVAFIDLSTNFPTKWTWTFESGDPSTSNVRNPRVTYNTPGTFKVTLIVENSEGTSAPLTKEAYISVSEEGLCSNVTNFDETFTPSLLRLKDFGPYTGYLTGHNSAKIKALSEIFANVQGYSYISGVKIKFGKAYAKNEDATATILVWNARGAQTGPGSVIERKTVLFKQIKEDVANDRETTITFDRETPVFSRAFHVGMEMTYGNDTLAVISSANGEANTSTSWVQNAAGTWQLYTIAYGANIAMMITPIVGMNPSVQVSSTKQYIYPGEEVTLSARGASIFIWNSSDDAVNSVPGPQITVTPLTTTVYETSGSGFDLCNATASTTIYVRTGVVTGVHEAFVTGVTMSPNPGSNSLNISFENSYRGPVQLSLTSLLSQTVKASELSKTDDRFEASMDTSGIAAGVYITTIRIDDNTYYGKWVKN